MIICEKFYISKKKKKNVTKKATCHVKSVKLLYESVLLLVVVTDEANDSFS